MVLGYPGGHSVLESTRGGQKNQTVSDVAMRRQG